MKEMMPEDEREEADTPHPPPARPLALGQLPALVQAKIEPMRLATSRAGSCPSTDLGLWAPPQNSC